MFSVKLVGSAVKRGNAAVSEAVSGAAAGVSGAAANLQQVQVDGVGKVRDAANAAAAAASSTSQEVGRVLKKGNEALKIDRVVKDINSAATSVSKRANNVFKGRDSGNGRASFSNSFGREHKWDEYGSENEDEDVDATSEGVLTALEKEILIAGLTDSEDMGPAVRAVHERGVSDTLVQALEELGTQRSGDILQACDQERALDMMRSVQLMVSLKEEVANAESRLANINTRLQSDGARLLQAQSDVLDMRQCQTNLEQTSQVLDECIAVIRLTCAVRQHLRNDKLHAALEALLHLQSLGLHNMRAPSLWRLLRQLLPVLTEEVKAQAVRDFNRWLALLRKLAAKVGRALLEGTLERGVQEAAARQSASRRVNGGSCLPLLKDRTGDVLSDNARGNSSGSVSTRSGEDGEEYQICGVGVEMGPLLMCLHLFRRLGQVDQLRAQLRSTRRAHAALDLEPPDLSACAKGNVDLCTVVRPYLEKVLGFFVLDQGGSRAPRACIDAGWVANPCDSQQRPTEQEWISHSGVLVQVVSEACQVAPDSAAMVQLRSVLWLFCGSLDRYNLTTRAIRSSLDSQRDHYIALLLEEGRGDVVSALNKDKLEALWVDNGVDLARLVVDLGIELDQYLHPRHKELPVTVSTEGMGAQPDRRGQQLAEPVAMIFSSSVPRLLQIAKNFAFDLASFLDLSSPNCLQVLLLALDRFLEQVIDRELVHVLNCQDAASSSSSTSSTKPASGPSSVGVRSKNSTAAALQAMQISLNAHVLCNETARLMEYAASLSPGPALEHAKAAAAQAAKSQRVFERTRMLGEDKMFACSAATVEDIMNGGDAEFEWAPTKAETQPSNYILELSSYLMATFPAFSALPAATREALYYITCKSISSRLLAQPHQPHVRKIHLAAFKRADVDLQVLETLAAETRVSGLKDCFSAPRQLVNLLTAASLEVVLDEVTRFQKFGTVDLAQLLALLEKVREPSAVNTMFFTTTTGSRKREVDAVVKRLRELVRSGE